TRKDVEGSLFVVKRKEQPRFQFIVMNRRAPDNLIEDLLGDFEYEVQPPYILYRNRGQEVNGIWFYSLKECHDAANLFSRILNTFSRHAHPTKPLIPSNSWKLFPQQPWWVDGPLEEPSPSHLTLLLFSLSFNSYFLSPHPSSPEYSELEAMPSAAMADGPFEPSPPEAGQPSSHVPQHPTTAPNSLLFLCFSFPRSPSAPSIQSWKLCPQKPWWTALWSPPHHRTTNPAATFHSITESAETKGPMKIHGEGRAAAAAAARDEAGNGVSATETGRRGEGAATKERGSEGEEGGEGESERMSGSESERMSRALAALLQPSHGAPMLQPFPPPTPPLSLASPAPPPALSPSIPAPPHSIPASSHSIPASSHSIPASSHSIPAPINPAVAGSGLGLQGGRGGEGVAVVVTREGLKAALLRLVQVGLAQVATGAGRTTVSSTCSFKT
ncbi:unnamed protein product, partial [Closterium sp. Naga37s-1]